MNDQKPALHSGICQLQQQAGQLAADCNILSGLMVLQLTDAVV
jgi:hypothetical protein